METFRIQILTSRYTIKLLKKLLFIVGDFFQFYIGYYALLFFPTQGMLTNALYAWYVVLPMYSSEYSPINSTPFLID